MVPEEPKNAVDDVKTEKEGEESAKQENRKVAREHHGEGFVAEDLAKTGKESKEGADTPTEHKGKPA